MVGERFGGVSGGTWRRGLLALLLTALLTALPRAQLLDSVILPGDRFTGEIETGDDVDVLQFDSVDGALATLIVVPLRGSALSPVVTLLDTDGETEVLSAQAVHPKKRKVVVKNHELPSTGTYTLTISGADGTTGGYIAVFVERLTKALVKQVRDLELAAGETVELAFDAADGYELTAVIARLGKASGANPAAPLVSDPDEEPIDPGASLITKSGKKGDVHVLKRLALDDTGTHVLAVTNAAGEGGGLRVVTVVKRPRRKPSRHEELEFGEVFARTLSGTVLGATDGLGLEGVTVSVDGGPETETDAQGNFVLQDPPVGEVQVDLDGSTFVNGPAGALFGALHVATDVSEEGASQLPQVIVLPDLNHADAANQSVGVDEEGAATEPIDTDNPAEDLDLRGPSGTRISRDGEPATGDVDVNITPVEPDEVPMPLDPEGEDPLDASSYVTIQPGDAAFDTTDADPGSPDAGPGLTALFPNDRGFPVGSEVEIWSFDHDAEDWVNRSEQFGVMGRVVDDGEGGSYIEGPGLIVKGGWHAPVRPVDPDKATVIKGRVVAAGGTSPVPGATVATTLGQFAQTDADGRFELASVPAYDVAALPACVPIDVGLVIVTPVPYGAEKLETTVLAGAVVQGDCTELGDLSVVVPQKGSLVGVVLDNGVPVEGAVIELKGASAVAGPQTATQRTTNPDGQFFAAGLAPGSWTASHLFAGDPVPTVVSFGIAPNLTTAVTLQRTGGAGKKTLTVKVIEEPKDAGGAPHPVSGAQVLVLSADSPAGLLGTTNALGKVTFETVTPPYTITAQRDSVLAGGGPGGPLRLREGVTISGIVPKSEVVTVPFGIGPGDEGDFGTGGPPPDATLGGTLADLPTELTEDHAFNVRVTDAVTGADLTTAGFGWVDPGTGAFHADVLSTDNPWHLVVELLEMDHHEGGGDPGDFGLIPGRARTVASLLVTGLADPGPGGHVPLTLDWDDAIDFDVETPLHWTATPADVELVLGHVLLQGEDMDGVILGDMYVQAPYGELLTELPDDVLLIDTEHPALDGLEVFFGLEVRRGHAWSGDPGITGGQSGFVDAGSHCEYDLRAVAGQTLVVDVPAQAPGFDDPAPDTFLPVSAAEQLVVHYRDGQPKKPRGMTVVALFSDGLDRQALGVDAVVWELYSRLGLKTLELPPTALPVFAPAVYDLKLGAFVLPTNSLDFDRFFDATLPAQMQALDEDFTRRCEHFAGQQLYVDPDPTP